MEGKTFFYCKRLSRNYGGRQIPTVTLYASLDLTIIKKMVDVHLPDCTAVEIRLDKSTRLNDKLAAFQRTADIM